MKVLLNKEIKLKNKNPLITFSTTGGGSWKEWDRFIEVENKKAFHIGNICGTCNFFFKKLEGALMKLNSKKLIESLKSTNSLDFDDIVKKISPLFESGRYYAIKLKIKPNHIIPFSDNDYFSKEIIDLYGIQEFSGLPFYPETTYYRDENSKINEDSKLFSFYIPMIPDSWLDDKTIKDYEDKFKQGITPVCISLAIFDKKQPADWADDIIYSNHYCYANYLIDGHHKIKAASNLNQEIDLISFLNIGKGISTIEDINRALAVVT